MMIIFIGKSKEFLSSFTQDIEGVSTIITTSEELEVVPYKFSCLKEEIDLFLIDVNAPGRNFKTGLLQLLPQFPNSAFWALFDTKSQYLRQELFRLGFKRIISYKDDLKELVGKAELRA